LKVKCNSGLLLTIPDNKVTSVGKLYDLRHKDRLGNFGAVSVRWCLRRFPTHGMEEVNGVTSLVPHHILDETIGFLEGDVVLFGR